jgi:hypothetical protein
VSEAQNGGNVMERLTNNAWRNFDPWECCGQDKYCQRGCHDPGGCTKGCIVPQLYARLGAYEDTGLTPGEVKSMQEEHFSGLEMAKLHSALMELKKYQEADKDGRLVVLPVKPVFTPILLYIIEDENIYEDALYEAVVGMSGNGERNVVYTTLSDQIIFEQADIGKTVFFTHEEAKKALEAMKDE